MTAAYSNAVLVAILPHCTDVAKKLELPIPTPIVQSQVRHFFCDPRAGEVGGYMVLTNGYEFWFQRGYVNGMSSPWNVFRLQDPDLLPRFYGPLRMNEKEAVALARKTLKKLGYTNSVIDTMEPEVQLESPRESFAVNQGVPQYRIIWHDPDRTDLDIAELDVNANVKHVDAFQLYSKIFWRTNLDAGIVPKLLHKDNPQPQYVGGIKMKPFTPAYSNTFLRVVLSQITDFARKLELPIDLPVTLQQCTNIDGGFLQNDPEVQIILTNSDRFLFQHGYVSLFYAYDNYFSGNLLYGHTMVKKADLYQSQPVSTNEMIRLAREAIHNLGYSENELHMEGPPDFITIPENTKTNFFTRYEIGWDFIQLPSGIEGYRVTIEVDAKTKSIKSILLYGTTNLWREPPKIGVPSESESVK
jgi:hypothetical protein